MLCAIVNFLGALIPHTPRLDPTESMSALLALSEADLPTDPVAQIAVYVGGEEKRKKERGEVKKSFSSTYNK
jgi:hypothetical protein